MHGYKQQRLFAFLYFCPDDDCSIQMKHRKLFPELKLVTDDLLLIFVEANWEATENQGLMW